MDSLGEAVPEPGTEEYARFVSCVLNPRVEHEVMTLYRRSLLEWMSAEEQRNFRKEPKLLWEKICRQIQERPEEERPSARFPAPETGGEFNGLVLRVQ